MHFHVLDPKNKWLCLSKSSCHAPRYDGGKLSVLACNLFWLVENRKDKVTAFEVLYPLQTFVAPCLRLNPNTSRMILALLLPFSCKPLLLVFLFSTTLCPICLVCYSVGCYDILELVSCFVCYLVGWLVVCHRNLSDTGRVNCIGVLE